MTQNKKYQQAIVSDVDPTTLSVVWNRFEHILDEIGEKVMFAAQSFVISTIRDLGQVFLNPRGEIVSVSCYITSHLFKSVIATQNIQRYLNNDFEPGDFIIANDPYIIEGAHLPDWSFVRPVFYKDELLGFIHFSGHMSDTGGFLPGGYAPGAYDIIAEGLNIPPIKLMKRGVLNKEIWDVLLRNIRNPTQVDMDTMLIQGACAQAEKHIVHLVDKYGLETIKTCMKEMIDAGERSARSEIKKIPDGTYYGEAGTDWDGTTDKPVYVRTEMTVKGDEITFDLSKSDPQATFVNTPMGTTVMSVMVAFYSMIDFTVPKNFGSMKPVNVIAPKGTVVNPSYPATVGACQIAVGVPIIEACQLALGQAVPELAMGGFPRHFCPIVIGMEPDVIDPRTGHPKQYFAESFASDGSGGAVQGYDGWPGVAFYGCNGNFTRVDMEIFESQVPYRVTRYEFMQDREGPGEFRGGPAVYIEMVADTRPGAPSIIMTGNCDGQIVAPVGSASGPIAKAEMWIRKTDETNRELRTMTNTPISPGEVVCTIGQGGGGWGDPLDRDTERIQNDVIDGYVSKERAMDIYGVVFKDDTFEIDHPATKHLRKEKKSKRQ